MKYYKITYSNGITRKIVEKTKEELKAERDALRASAPTVVSKEEITKSEYEEPVHIIHQLSEAEIAERKAKQKLRRDIAKIKMELASLDYIGVKIATGVATVEEYAEQIALAEELRAKLRELLGE